MHRARVGKCLHLHTTIILVIPVHTYIIIEVHAYSHLTHTHARTYLDTSSLILSDRYACNHMSCTRTYTHTHTHTHA